MPLLTPLTGSDEKTFLDIATAKRGKRATRLKNAWTSIKKRYKHYEDRSAILETLIAAKLSDIRKRDCKHCYKYTTKPLSDLIGQVLQIVPASKSTMCQYCLIGEIDSVDHYAPQDLFPEFSVFARNLVASCGLCNRLKNAKWLKNGVRDIFSLYFDDLPTDQFLYVEIDFPSGNRAKVSFDLNRPSGMSTATFARIERQFEILKLIERYNKAGAEFVSEMLLSTKALRPKKKSIAEKQLKRVAAGYGRQFGRNHMKRLICRKLASSRAFMILAGMK